MGPRVVVGACGASMNKTFKTGLRPGKTGKPPLRAMEKRSPFGGWRHHLSPASGGTTTRDLLCATYEIIASRSFIVPPLQRGGKGTGFVGSPWATENPVTRFTPWRRWCRRHQRGKSRCRRLITELLFSAYDTKEKHRIAFLPTGFYSHMLRVPRFFASLRMTIGRKGKSRNALASPLGEEGHEVAQGCTTLQVELILYAALTANRQPSCRLVFNSICFMSGTYRDSSPTAQNDA